MRLSILMTTIALLLFMTDTALAGKGVPGRRVGGGTRLINVIYKPIALVYLHQHY
ncbi:MAG: hypothetical protein KME42_23885 [Tildeniella nuda ZEHNDER 1965/U140]|jgi:hypothetical protein|nr:hypothetical protein [Tildeniella nuda ZEHNDER 1965/U140]